MSDHLQDGPNHCSECGHDHLCVETVSPDEDRTGLFPNGEWQCTFCIRSEYWLDPMRTLEEREQLRPVPETLRAVKHYHQVCAVTRTTISACAAAKRHLETIRQDRSAAPGDVSDAAMNYRELEKAMNAAVQNEMAACYDVFDIMPET